METSFDEGLRRVAPPDAVHDVTLWVHQRQAAALGVEGLVELGVGHDADLLTSPHQQAVAVGRDRGALGPGVDGQVLPASRQPVDQGVAFQVKRLSDRVIEFDELQVIVAARAGLHLADDQRGGDFGRLGRSDGRRGHSRRCAGRQDK